MKFTQLDISAFEMKSDNTLLQYNDHKTRSSERLTDGGGVPREAAVQQSRSKE